jgi:hypothetical protein
VGRGRIGTFGLAGRAGLLAGLSCPGAALAQSWSAPIALDPSVALRSVACPSADQCTAVGGGVEVTFDPTSPGTPAPTNIDSRHTVVGIACPSLSQCTAVDGGGGAITFNPTSVGQPLPAPVTVDDGGGLTGVACPSSSQCTGVDSAGGVVTFNPSSPGSPNVIELDSSDFNTLSGVACPSPTQCTTGDQDGSEVTFNPIAPGGPKPPDNPTGVDNAGAYMDGVACPATNQCTMVDDQGQEVTFDPKSPGSPVQITIADNALNGIACTSTSNCVAVGGGGDVVDGDPAVGGGWTLVPIPGAARVNAVSCDPSGAVCVAVNSAGDAFVGPAGVTTGSHADATGFGRGRAQLSFTLTAAAGAAPVNSITVLLPKGLAFSTATQSLAEGVLVTANGKKRKLGVKLRHGRLTISLKSAADSLRVRLARPAITITRRLANNVRHGRVKTLQISLTVTSKGHAATSITLESAAS